MNYEYNFLSVTLQADSKKKRGDLRYFHELIHHKDGH